MGRQGPPAPRARPDAGDAGQPSARRRALRRGGRPVPADRSVLHACLSGDTEAERALDEIVRQLEAAQQDIIVGQGSLLIIDNYRAVHGRKAFTARFDGTDRWLKKLIIARNLRPSRGIRAFAHPRRPASSAEPWV
ncbi:TauD/TfdA family dioxygenase [Streptomyces sp. NPDC001514]